MTLLLLWLWAADGDALTPAFISHEDFYKPAGVRVDPVGNLYVPDEGEHTVWRFDAQGKFLGRIGREGQGPGEFSSPGDVAFLSDGTVVVADCGNRRLHFFSQDGTFQHMVAIAEQPVGQVVVLPGDRLVLSRVAGGMYSFKLGEDTPARFGVFSREGKQEFGFGTFVTHENPLMAMMLNRGAMAPMGDTVVFADTLENRVTFYKGKEEHSITYPLRFMPEKPDVVQKETKNSDGTSNISMSVRADLISNGLAVVGSDEVLVLRAVDKESENGVEPVRLSVQGEVRRIYPYKLHATGLAVSPDGAFAYFINELEEETTVGRLAL